MSNSLTSHEDLTPYIEQLARINHSATYQLERRRSFAADPETIIKELLTEVMSCRKAVTQCTSIAEKFLEAYQTATEDTQRVHDRTKLLEHELGDQSLKLQKYQKELEIKDKRLDSLTLEATDMERILKISNQDCNKMKKEIDALKKELSQKEQSTAIRENTIQQRQKLFVEENREKEIDKTMQIKYDNLNADYKKKVGEIDGLKNKISEFEGLFNAERAGFEKMSSLNNQLRNEISIQKIEMINFKDKYSQMKDRVKDLKEEIMQLKLNNESLQKELDYSRVRRESIISGARESLEIHDDIVDLIRGTTGQNKPENLGAFMDELEEKGKNFGSDPFFMISPQGAASPKFILCQTKKIEKHEGFLIEPIKQTIYLVKNTGFVYENTKNPLEKSPFKIQKCEDFNVKTSKKNPAEKKVKSPFKIQKCEDFNVKIHAKKLSAGVFKGFSYVKELKMAKVENNFYIKPAIFQFDDSVSVTSNETEATPRSRRMSIIENRDPIKQFFYYVRNI